MNRLAKTAALSFMDASGLGALMRPVFRGRGMILTLHSVARPETVAVTPGSVVTTHQLDSLLGFIRDQNWDVIALREVPERLRSSAEQFFVCLTLDDGYADNFCNAVPLFRKYETPYSLFVVTAAVDRVILPFWAMLDELVATNDAIQLEHPKHGLLRFACDTYPRKVTAAATLRAMGWQDHEGMGKALRQYCTEHGLSADEMANEFALSWEQLHELGNDKLATIGSHTVHHLQLAKLTDDEAAWEMAASRARLQEALQRPIEEIAYPFGSVPGCCGSREFRMAREVGYQRGVTSQRWNLFESHARDLLALPRIGLSLPHADDQRYLRLSSYGAWNAVCRVFSPA